MTNAEPAASRVEAIGEALPYLRRYARALTGRQTSGDRYAAAALEALLEDGSAMERLAPRAALFHVFHRLWSSSGQPVAEVPEGPEAAAQRHLAQLTPNSREALLLHAVEGFPFDELAQVLDLSQDQARDLVEIARREMSDATIGKVLIVEDEAIIAMDLESVVADLGHKVTGIARTRARAIELAMEEAPDLVLCDIQLADDSSGIDAANEILEQLGERPVIFITAFPERLLTGERPEPAFLIAKPYTEEQVRSAVSQAMFFSSTETLRA
ncbi:MAG: response regulator [Rhodosalinus sp.]|uniref:response regulator n=1 Tax=Rhodosalinus sp. TaxID=2047741 RepID=UPI00397D308F